MTRADTTPPILAERLAAPVTVAEPDVVGSLAVFPLIAAAAPSMEYVAFAEACGRGVTIKELPGGASVNDLIVHNPTELTVLLYEGEEVLGAQQNRTFDISVLVAAGTSLPVPVSCVEQGRWDHRRHDEAFAPAPQAAHPQLRRLKNERVREALAGGRGAARRPAGGVGRGGREVHAPRRRLGHGSAARRVRGPAATSWNASAARST